MFIQVQPNESQCFFQFSTLTCDGNKANITSFPRLNPNPSLTGLSIVNTNLTELQFGKVELPHYPSLTLLVLSFNGIHISNLSLVVNNPTIEGLHLQENRLSEIPVDMLEVLLKLKYLDLSNNRIDTIEKYSFRENQLLELLLLNDNKIQVIHQYAFEGLDKLQYLHLKGNVIHEFPFKESNYSFPDLKGMTLSKNNISILASTSDVFVSCNVLYLNFNRIEYLGNYSLKAFPNISHLFLDHNFIFSLDAFLFGEQPHNLSYLILSYNSLVELPLSLLRQIPRLKTLSLANNLLTTVPANAFIHNPWLEIIVLRNNRIHSIHSLALVGLSSLRLLNLAHNKLTTLQAELFQPVGYFFLELSGNNLTCDCDIFFLQMWLKKSPFGSDKIECFFLQTGENELVIDVPLEDMCVSEEYITTLAGITELSPTEETDWLNILIKYGPAVTVIGVSSLIAVVVICVICRAIDEQEHHDDGDTNVNAQSDRIRTANDGLENRSNCTASENTSNSNEQDSRM
ncbi:Carboxypeptidase N subunit 2 [Holothuria leucospilota]|uniref:Carboxypeptidase N subunit 2 n=1 Tax=Holothuria leucospilota TaxID=206669 RepID=A0A9Q0YLV6_HOLLE|nr:Carboxypeptidase N subunit 2 [Holothuria leucospilota]